MKISFIQTIFTCALIGAATVGNAQIQLNAQNLLDPEARMKRMMEQIAQNPTQQKKFYISQILNLSGTSYVTQADIDLTSQRLRAQRRAALISQVYQLDLDGDGLVTRAEIEMPSVRNNSARRRTVDAIMVLYSHDLDGDDALSFHEVLAYAAHEAKSRNQHKPQLLNQMLMKMDVNGDGRTEIAEVVDFIDAEVAKAKKQTTDRPYRVAPEDED